MKRFLNLFLVTCILIAMLPCQVSASEMIQETTVLEEVEETTESENKIEEEVSETIVAEDILDISDSMHLDNVPMVMSVEETESSEEADDELVLYGDAVRFGTEKIQLTGLEFWQGGSAWYGHQIDTTKGFTTSFDFWAGGGRDNSYGGADGFVLTFSPEKGLGGEGKDIGFVGEGAVGVELDSYPGNPNDPGGKHIAIIKDTVTNHLVSILDDRVDNSQWHTLKVTYKDNTLKVYLDDEELLKQTDVSLPVKAYLGISAATGEGYNYHFIKDFNIEGVISSGENFEEDNDPIIIVPGIMGSRFFISDTIFDDTTKVWEPVVSLEGLARLSDNMDKSKELFVRPSENQKESEEREYGAIETYKQIVDRLCDTYSDSERDIYVFSYDWRKSNSENADKLAEFINDLDTDKVDIVCHSMGGLVTSSYYSRYASDEKVDMIITCGTPYEGAPQLLNSVQNLDVVGKGVLLGSNWKETLNNGSDLVLGLFGMKKEVKASFLGVVELTPTENYVAQFPMKADADALFNIGDYDLTYRKYVQTCNRIFGTENYKSAQDFQNSLLQTYANGEDYNVLLGYDKAYFIIGTGQKTISSIKFQNASDDIDQKLYETDLNYEILGDGTVPYYSASICEQLSKDEYAHRVQKVNTTHMGVVQDETCLDYIVAWLDGGEIINKEVITTAKSYTVIRVACPVDITLTQGEEILSSDPEQLAISSSFGRLDILGENDDIKMLCVDSGDEAKIVLNGTDIGTMDYMVRFFDAQGNLYDERIFEGVPVTEDTIIHTDIDETHDTVLAVDGDGDGETDYTWTAAKNEWVTTSDEDRILLKSISLSCGSDIMEVGETVQLEVVNMPDNATDKVAISLKSSDESVVTVSEDGNITAVSEGTVVITAIASNGLQETLEITIVDHIHNYETIFNWSEDYQNCEATFTCTKCAYSQDVETEIIMTETPATCMADGEIVYLATADYADITAEAQEVIILPATGHSYLDTVISPTETEQGYTEHVCKSCGDSYRDTYVDMVVLLPQQKITCQDSLKKQIRDKDFMLNAKNKSVRSGVLYYASSNEAVVTVSNKGKVHINETGTAIITITAPAVEGKYAETIKEVTIIVEEAKHHEKPNKQWDFWKWWKIFWR